ACAVMFENPLAAFLEKSETYAEAGISRLCSGYRLKKQVHGRTLLQTSELSGDMREAAGLRGNSECSDQAIKSTQNRRNRRDGISGGVDANYRVAAAIQQAVERREKNAADVVSWMVGLETNAEHSALAHRVAATRDVANLRGRQD